MNSVSSINGLDVSELNLSLPRIGVWHATVLIDSPKQLSGKAELKFGSQVFQGTFGRNDVDSNLMVRGRIIGGAGSLGKMLPPRGYRSVPIKIPLQDALFDAGEKLSPESDRTLLQIQLSAWSRLQTTAGQVIESLLRSAHVPSPVWRMLPDGTIWIGYEVWKEAKPIQFEIINSEPERGILTIASFDPVVMPGTVFRFKNANRKISNVNHVLTPRSFYTTIYYE